ncbi:MAG: YciI family protein [Vicinamibacterales bacterium]
MPQYMLLLHEAADALPADIGPAEIEAIIARYIAWRAKVEQAGHAVSGHKLKDGEGRVLTGRAGAPSVTDGPYAEAREVIGGLFIIEAGSYDEAVRLSTDHPHLDFGTIEIREIEPTG